MIDYQYLNQGRHSTFLSLTLYTNVKCIHLYYETKVSGFFSEEGILHELLCSLPVFGGVRVAHILSFLCCAFCFDCFDLCFVPSVARVYALSILDCPSVLSNVYWNRDGQQFQQYQLNEQISLSSNHWTKKTQPHYVYANGNPGFWLVLTQTCDRAIPGHNGIPTPSLVIGCPTEIMF